MSEFKRVINIIPLTPVNLGSSQIFTYLVPLRLQDQLRPGQLVVVPFRARKILGVTSAFEMHRLPHETRGLKEMIEIADTVPVLSEKSLTLANWLANYYITPLGLVIKAMLPKFVAPKDPETPGYEKFNPDFILTEHQRLAFAHISNILDKSETVLLAGITGSGKTEVYMQAIERVLQSGRQVIILVPEISLTSQAIERFARRFGIEKIALIHSRLKSGERFWIWDKIRQGEKPIIIGPRSAIFAPVQNLGLIVIDEEHDSSFKQYDQNPKYHAGTVAQKLSQIWNCPLILGDATPSVETFYHAVASHSKHPATLLSLPHRIMADVGLPKVRVVDMRKEIQAGNTSIFSETLKAGIIMALKQNKQIILFLNRRGAATFVMCRDCASVATCTDCSVSLVYHQASKKLVCHHCGKTFAIPETCLVCHGPRIKYFGIGTQTVEAELKKFLTDEFKSISLPEIVRMDRDTTLVAGRHQEIYKDWVSGKTRILIGTQMIAKGWDVSSVGLVGIITADTILHLPDFRSAEKTFQVLTQVAGRAGRGADTGTVILQTYNPENFAIAAAKFHDYEAFFNQEIENRRKYGYPPFVKLVKITARHRDQEKALLKASAAVQKLLKKREVPMEILGPVPSFIPRLRGQYRYQIILKLPANFQADLYSILQVLPSDLGIDVDPDSLL